MFVKTLTALAEQIGCARETLSRWKSPDKTFPKPMGKRGYDVDAAKRWLLENDKLNSNNAPAADKELYTLKCKIAKQDIERNALEIAEMKRKLVDFDEAKDICAKILLPIGRRLKDLPASMCGKCNPADPSFAKGALQTWADETLNLIQKQCKKLKDDK